MTRHLQSIHSSCGHCSNETYRTSLSCRKTLDMASDWVRLPSYVLEADARTWSAKRHDVKTGLRKHAPPCVTRARRPQGRATFVSHHITVVIPTNVVKCTSLSFYRHFICCSFNALGYRVHIPENRSASVRMGERASNDESAIGTATYQNSDHDPLQSRCATSPPDHRRKPLTTRWRIQPTWNMLEKWSASRQENCGKGPMATRSRSRWRTIQPKTKLFNAQVRSSLNRRKAPSRINEKVDQL